VTLALPYVTQWIKAKGLDQYGSKSGTMYAGGNPAFDMNTGEMTDRYEHIAKKHPAKPWKPAQEL
jgi:hypothetical protein